MRILVIGSGGREHAFVWKLKQSPKVKEIFCAPGNAGIAEWAELVPLTVDDIDGTVQSPIEFLRIVGFGRPR